MQVWRFWAAAVCICGFATAWAQPYPAKPVRIVTVAPGSANDIVARLIAQEIRAGLGQSVVVDNRGAVAAEHPCEHALRSGQGLCADHAGGEFTECRGGAPVAAGEVGARIDRAGAVAAR